MTTLEKSNRNYDIVLHAFITMAVLFLGAVAALITHAIMTG